MNDSLKLDMFFPESADPELCVNMSHDKFWFPDHTLDIWKNVFWIAL